MLGGKTERHSGSIKLLNESRKASVRWNFRQAWPRNLDGPAFKAKTNEVAIETLEIVVEGVEVENVG